jgi:hypothetical protein
LAPGSQLLTTVRGIGPDLFEAGIQWSNSSKQASGTFPIVEIGRRDIHSEEKTKRIHQNVALASFHAFMRIEATDPGRFLNRFDADAASMMAALGWAFLPTRSRSASRSTVSSRNQVPGIAQTAKMVEHRLPGREVGWQVAPRAARAQHIEDRIEDGSQWVNWWSPSLGHGREIALQTRPLRIRQIAGITGTHPSSLSYEVTSAINKTRSYSRHSVTLERSYGLAHAMQGASQLMRARGYRTP